MMFYRFNVFVAVLIFVCCASVFGIVLHPGKEPSPSWSERPSSNVMGRWGSNASCVVISPDCVITTNHQGGGVGTNVVIGGVSYKVSRVERFGTSDVRIAKLRGAQLTEYVLPYSGSDELYQNFVIGGFGQGRGAELTTAGQTYGYQWDGSSNTTLRWGTNTVELVRELSISAYFAAPDEAATEYEAILAVSDSGGGWFMKKDGQWVVICLSSSVSTMNKALFKDPTTLDPSPDRLTGNRVSNYAEWMTTLASSLGECGSMAEDINEDCKVDIADFKEFISQWASAPNPSSIPRRHSDINSDNKVNMLDFARIATQWNGDYLQ